MRKILLLITAMLFVLSTQAQSLKVFTPSNTSTTDYDPIGISPNGKYLIGWRYFISPTSGTTSYTYFIMDWEEASSEDWYANGYRWGTFTDVNDIGNACGSVYDGTNIGMGYCVPTIKDGQKGTTAHFYQQDGSDKFINSKNTVVGYVRDYDKSISVPWLWSLNGSFALSTPTSAMNNIQTNYSLIPIYISDDEGIIYGTLKNEAGYGCIPVKWIYNGNGYECITIASDFIEPKLHTEYEESAKPYKEFEIFHVSPNGEWLSVRLMTKENKSMIARYNTSTDSLEVLGDGYDSGAIANDGTMVGQYDKGNYYWPANADSAYIFEDVFPIVKEQLSYMAPKDISADGRTILGENGNSIVVLSDAIPTIPSGIQNVVNEKNIKTGIYNLIGVRLKEYTKPGIYIKNGKKIIVGK